MTGIALDFTGELPELGTGKVAGFAATVQNALVNLGTGQGSDPLFPERGTTLQQDAVEGKLIDLNSAQHSSNFAAVDTLSFGKVYTATDDPDGLSTLQLAPADFTGSRVLIDALFTATDGRVVGVKTTI